MVIIYNADNILNKPIRFVLAGNPNVGKSTLFNNLSGDTQHTGNWTGKTVDTAYSEFYYNGRIINLVDLPGTYSLNNDSSEEKVTTDYIYSDNYDVVIIVINSTLLKQNLLLALQILMYTTKAIICLNMTDEAEKLKVTVDADELSLQTGVPVVKISANSKVDKDDFLSTALSVAENKRKTFKLQKLADINESAESYEEIIAKLSAISDEICAQCITKERNTYTAKDRFLDKLFTSRFLGTVSMISIIFLVFWLTAFGANYPSDKLSEFLFFAVDLTKGALSDTKLPLWFVSIIADGIMTTVSWVVSVMLPPAFIFFLLFSLLEESGVLPRIAMNFDRLFRKAGINGKLSLTMLMGFGCNACGVMGCRINKTKKERIIAIVTNSFIPCNGRLPSIFAITSIFIASESRGFRKSLIVTIAFLVLIALSFAFTLVSALILSKTKFKNESSTFILELPTYRKPKILKILTTSIRDKVFYVLSRAVLVSIPAGIAIWIMTNISIDNILLAEYVCNFFDPLAKSLGMDGVLLTAFILAFPANEIVLPITLMSYINSCKLIDFSSLSQLSMLLSQNGWTLTTALCFVVFTVFHFPCSTTCFAIYKETKSIRWTLFSLLLPLIIGFSLCFVINLISI